MSGAKTGRLATLICTKESCGPLVTTGCHRYCSWVVTMRLSSVGYCINTIDWTPIGASGTDESGS